MIIIIIITTTTTIEYNLSFCEPFGICELAESKKVEDFIRGQNRWKEAKIIWASMKGKGERWFVSIITNDQLFSVCFRD